MMRIGAFLFIFSVFLACEEQSNRADAYGNFEAVPTVVAAESGGRLLFFDVQEGSFLSRGLTVGQLDTVQLHLQVRQLDARLGTLPAKLKDADDDIAVVNKQKENLVREQQRITRLMQKNAATQKQLDDVVGQIEVLDRQIVAMASSVQEANAAILAEKAPLLAERRVMADRLKRSTIYNPVSGTVLTKMAEAHEIVAPGMPLYRIANLDTLVLRFYVDAIQLQTISLGSEIKVLIDEGSEAMSEMSGKVSWISDRAEFTPRTIQTKEERVHLVYAIKALVANHQGRLKIGMPAEVSLSPGKTN